MRVLLMYGWFSPSAQHRRRVAEIAGEAVVVDSEAAAIAAAGNAEVIAGHRYLRQVLPHAPSLRWVQSTAGGVDALPLAALAERRIVLTRTVHTAPTIARHAHTLAWALHRQLPLFIGAPPPPVHEVRWSPTPRTAAVFGTGAIGQHLAQLLRADGIRTIGVRRTPAALPDFDATVTLTEAPAILRGVDWCFCALPARPELTGWFNQATLQRLPSHALFINIGRGETVVTEDLLQAVECRQLGGAALDVIAAPPERISARSSAPLNLIITPHIAAHSRERPHDAESYFETQLARFVARQPLEHTVDIATSCA